MTSKGRLSRPQKVWFVSWTLPGDTVLLRLVPLFHRGRKRGRRSRMDAQDSVVSLLSKLLCSINCVLTATSRKLRVMSTRTLSQPTRLVIFAIYVGVLISASFLALGTWPPLSAKGLWFYTGIVSLILSNLLTTPFFTTPQDAVADVLVAAFALVAASEWKTWQPNEKAVFIIAIAFLALTMLTAI